MVEEAAKSQSKHADRLIPPI